MPALNGRSMVNELAQSSKLDPSTSSCNTHGVSGALDRSLTIVDGMHFTARSYLT